MLAKKPLYFFTVMDFLLSLTAHAQLDCLSNEPTQEGARVTQSFIKPIVSKDQYLCAVGNLYNLTCSEVLNAHKPYEQEFLKNRGTPISSDAPYLIEPRTHRIWFTLPEDFREVPRDRLKFYNSSLQFYKDKPYEHHFWCNNASLIPQTIATIKSFNVPVTIHEISEIEENFIAQKLFQHFLRDNHLSKAGNIARQEILLQYGGLYSDIGLEQMIDLDDYFQKYSWIQVIGPDSLTNSYTLGAPKNYPFLKNTLQFVRDIPKTVASLDVLPDTWSCAWLTTSYGWKIFWGLKQVATDSVGFVYHNADFKYHGFASWHNGKWGASEWSAYVDANYYQNMGE